MSSSLQITHARYSTSAGAYPFRPYQQRRGSERIHKAERRLQRDDSCRCSCVTVHRRQATQHAVHAIVQRWPTLSVLAPVFVGQESRASETAEAAKDAASAAASSATELSPDVPTVTFGGSFNQYDPVIAFFFYAVVATLAVLTIGVG